MSLPGAFEVQDVSSVALFRVLGARMPPRLSLVVLWRFGRWWSPFGAFGWVISGLVRWRPAFRAQGQWANAKATPVPLSAVDVPRASVVLHAISR
ncbi:hypothetical protein [Spirillospora sp. CA-294931]|uniref:hypothetical protein n=1 Tax=Spirillospora sp. CA-294931 TaxID=3240042 RepID=UPI003D8B92D1